MLSTVPAADHLAQLRQEAQMFANAPFILEKMSSDGHLLPVTQLVQRVISQEVTFAFRELTQMQKESEVFDINAQLIRNTIIFKENMKLILGSLGRLISGHGLDECRPQHPRQPNALLQQKRIKNRQSNHRRDPRRRGR
jgi:hypothetical protein